MASVIGASSAALRKVIVSPLARMRRRENIELVGERASFASESIDSIIETEIIPRLMIAHSNSDPKPQNSRTSEIDPLAARKFAELPLHLEAAGLLEEVDAYLDEGVSVESVYIDLLAPAARKLGELWEQDECDFVDVTMGLWRLQEVMREIAARSSPIISAISARHSILVAPIPGDQHSFGSVMLEDVFARAGWDSVLLVEPERSEILDCAAQKPFDVLGLTITRDCPSAAVAHIINAIRGVAANPQMSIMIGGRVVNENPDLVVEVGADGTAIDACSALEVAERLAMRTPTHAQQMR